MATRNLKSGCSGNDVKSLQKKLNKLGFNCGAVDGVFGPKTDAAVRKFQRSVKITVDGIVGPQTRAALAGKTKKKSKNVVKKKTKKKKKTTTSHEIGRWGGHKFVISANKIESFKGLQIKGSSELKDKKNTSQGTVARKGANPKEVSFTVVLNAYTGSDVRDKALKLVNQASDGKTDYFYVGNKKLVSCKLMLTDAAVKEPSISQSGKWTSAEVSVTMKQCNKGGGSSSSSKSSSNSSGSSSGGAGSSGGGSQKISVRSTSPTTTTKTNTLQKIVNGVKTAVGKVASANKSAVTKVPSANATIRKITTLAKSNTAAKKYGGGGTRYAMTR